MSGLMTLTTKILAAALVTILLMAGLQFALRGYTDPALLGDHSSNPEPLDIAIAGTTLRIPQNIIRRSPQRRAGKQETVDLYFQWPSFKGYTDEDAELFEDVQNLPDLIFATLVEGPPPDSPQRRLDGIYRRFFIKKPWRGPDGLIGQSLDPASGYQAEDVFYARLNGEEIFVARCLQEQEAAKNNVQPTCLYDFTLSKNLTVNVRFHRGLLPAWRAIDANIKSRLASMRAD